MREDGEAKKTAASSGTGAKERSAHKRARGGQHKYECVRVHEEESRGGGGFALLRWNILAHGVRVKSVHTYSGGPDRRRGQRHRRSAMCSRYERGIHR